MSLTRVNRALSIRQPYVEQILRGEKRFEYRNRPCNIRERVYIYASLRPGDAAGFRKLGKEPGELKTGLVVGTVEITGCSRMPSGGYRWHLARPRRLRSPIAPHKHPQPAWFTPF